MNRVSETVLQISSYTFSELPSYADDPRIATRGRPGASAVALGRRIMESANPQLKRHNSVSQLSKLLSCTHVSLELRLSIGALWIRGKGRVSAKDRACKQASKQNIDCMLCKT